MKYLPHWSFVAALALACAALCLAYVTVLAAPWWVDFYAGLSAVILAALARALRQWQHSAAAYEPGTCNHRPARRHRLTGEVQFLLWRKGEMNCGRPQPADIWCPFHPFWWPGFNPRDSAALDPAAAESEPAMPATPR